MVLGIDCHTFPYIPISKKILSIDSAVPWIKGDVEKAYKIMDF